MWGPARSPKFKQIPSVGGGEESQRRLKIFRQQAQTGLIRKMITVTYSTCLCKHAEDKSLQDQRNMFGVRC